MSRSGGWVRWIARVAVIAGSLLVVLLSAAPALAIAPAGSFIKVTGTAPIYVVVGGAAIHVDSCAPLGGCPGLQMIPSLAGYAAVPANGSFVRIQDGPSAGFIGVVSGGALIHVDSCAPLSGCPGVVGLDSGGAAAYMAAHPVPANGSFVRIQDGPSVGFIGTVVGGAVIHVDSCAPLAGCPGVVGLDSGGAAAYVGAHPVPANGSFVRIADGVNAGLIRRAAGGAFLPVTDCAPLGGCPGPVSIDSGGFGAYMGAHPVPADGTLLRGLPSQTVWVVLGGQREPAGNSPAAVAVNDASLALIPVASPATTGTGTTTPAPPPAPPRHGIQRRLRVTLALRWQWSRNRTRLLGLTIGRHPHAVTITVTCRGKGCPLPAGSATYRRLHRLRLVLDGRVYRAGDRLLITLRARGYRAERVEVRIRDGKIPRAQLR
jgi:hypothetical protein